MELCGEWSHRRRRTVSPEAPCWLRPLRTRVLVCCHHGTAQQRPSSIRWLEPAQGPPAATYQTRVSGYVGLDREAGDAALAAYAELYGQVERKLFADVAAGRSAAPLKSDYIREHGIHGADVQRGTGVAGRQGVGGAGGAAVAGGQLGAANCSRGTAGCAGRGTGPVGPGSPEAASAGQPAVQI